MKKEDLKFKGYKAKTTLTIKIEMDVYSPEDVDNYEQDVSYLEAEIRKSVAYQGYEDNVTVKTNFIEST